MSVATERIEHIDAAAFVRIFAGRCVKFATKSTTGSLLFRPWIKRLDRPVAISDQIGSHGMRSE
jgi:hypothetical protein